MVIGHQMVDAGGLPMHIAEAGTGPLVILLHGFPECWYSWRHQLPALAEAGFHAVAPDQRGYCRSGRPRPVEQYTILHLAGDIIALMDALGEQTAVVAGHDWGAPVAWSTALMRPDRVRAVIGLSVPYRPRGSSPPLPTLRALFGDGFYMAYFQQPGTADAELAADPADQVHVNTPRVPEVRVRQDVDVHDLVVVRRILERHDAREELFHRQGGLKYLDRSLPKCPIGQGCGLAGLQPPPDAEDKGFGSAI